MSVIVIVVVVCVVVVFVTLRIKKPIQIFNCSRSHHGTDKFLVCCSPWPGLILSSLASSANIRDLHLFNT